MQHVSPHMVVFAQLLADQLERVLDPGAKSSPGLSEREAACLKLAAEGLLIKQTALRLGISEQTVNFHLMAARHKLHAHNTTNAVAIAMAQNLIKIEAVRAVDANIRKEREMI